MRELIQKVREWGVERNIVYTGAYGQNKRDIMESQARYALKETAELLDAYADQDIDKINDAIGDILVTLIVGASSDDGVLEEFKDWLCIESEDKFRPDQVHFFNCEYGLLLNTCFILAKENYRDAHKYIACCYRLGSLLHAVNWQFKQDLELKDCLELAYNEIKDRKGKVVNGQFVKE